MRTMNAGDKVPDATMQGTSPDTEDCLPSSLFRAMREFVSGWKPSHGINAALLQRHQNPHIHRLAWRLNGATK